MDTNEVGEHLEFLHQAIDDYSFNGRYDSPDTESDGFSSAGEDACDVELEEHVFRKKLQYVKKNCSSDDEIEAGDIFGCGRRKTPLDNRSQKIQCLKEALELNSKLRDSLLSLEQNLVQALQTVTAKKLNLQQSKCEYKPVDKSDFSEPWNVPSGFYNQFSIPYFKDKDQFLCPPNADTIKKRANGGMVVVDLSHRTWRLGEMKYLEEGIKSCLIDEFKEAYRRRTRETVISTVISRVPEVVEYIRKVKATPLGDLFETLGRTDFDWLKISATFFKGSRSETECKKMWLLYANPSVNKQPWTSDESQMLKMLALSHNHQNWKQIADQLGSGRTAYQCFIFFQTKLNVNISSGPWTEYEDARLKNIINMCRYGPFISWPRVCYYMEGRTFNQLYGRYTRNLAPNIKKGKFTPHEDSIIIDAIYNEGQSCRDIARYLGNRNSSQIREHYTNQLKTLLELNMGEWTLEEDEKLLSLVESFGESHWAEIADNFGTRSRVQIRYRYKVLKTKMEKDPNFSIQQLKRSSEHNLRRQRLKRTKAVKKVLARMKKKKSQNVSAKLPRGIRGRRREKKKLVTVNLGQLPENFRLMDHREWEVSMKSYFRSLAVRDAWKEAKRLQGIKEVNDDEDEKVVAPSGYNLTEYFIQEKNLFIGLFEPKGRRKPPIIDSEIANDLEALGQLFKVRFNWKDIYEDSFHDERLKPLRRALKILKVKYETDSSPQSGNVTPAFYRGLLPANVITLEALERINQEENPEPEKVRGRKKKRRKTEEVEDIESSLRLILGDEEEEIDTNKNEASMNYDVDLEVRKEHQLLIERLKTLFIWPLALSRMANMKPDDENDSCSPDDDGALYNNIENLMEALYENMEDVGDHHVEPTQDEAEDI
ncbi:hypothetical protein AAG570_013500 [Ranatra chinensis]|uniref:snRNA-activating protein complex subunit 4 n=1 Tax=Ranatra chinensis TaxID=642074 RepID=A0ABD0YCD0_9HEMI